MLRESILKAWYYMSIKLLMLNIVKSALFFGKKLCCITYFTYLCTVFFMVLDLRLTMKIGCRETTFSF
jgi:hypothetical protein